MNLTPPSTVGKLQTVLGAKAKESPTYRFYALYDKVYRKDVLWWAYVRCHLNRGAAGVDGQTFEAIEEYGRHRWLDELAKDLRDKTYRPEAVRRVWIAKSDGKQRPLGCSSGARRVARSASRSAPRGVYGP
jgi:RNA-directed DNA polymerase